ncbi:MAG: carboxypeptidase-like regulatory domain-containing protein, partial [Bacteroidota bacterium]|nr:carboxypeptidase-like regulatory domain-containing protein [Bacteroidota bacterium]
MLLFKTSTKFSLLSFVLFCFLGCIEDPTGNSNNDTTIPNNNFIGNFGQSATHNFIGQVVDLQNNPVVGASILIGSSTTTTDSNGIFILRNAEVFDKFAHIKAEKAGFINGSRSLVPTSGFNHVKIMLLPKTVTQTVSSGVPTTVNLSNGAAVELLGNYSKLDGTIYSGNVQV